MNRRSGFLATKPTYFIPHVSRHVCGGETFNAILLGIIELASIEPLVKIGDLLLPDPMRLRSRSNGARLALQRCGQSEEPPTSESEEFYVDDECFMTIILSSSLEEQGRAFSW